MSKKVLIEIEDGNIVFTASNVEDLNIIVIDRDLTDDNQNPVKVELHGIDEYVEELWDLFQSADKVNLEIRKKLKEIE